MNYPFWQIPAIGGGVLIALIAILHVYISHLAVGGGLFLVWTERKARREKDEALLAYVKKHTRFFLLLTMVFGGLTGVGIWFIIALVHPQGTSALIHNFVFGWAIEWTFFVGEIISLLLYYYLWDRLRPGFHMLLGWLYFVFAWLSLFIINGIITFMLTPGRWLETQQFWHGFFNPTFWPSLLFRTGLALVFAGLFGLVTAVRMPNGGPRTSLLRYCGRWMLIPFVLIVLGGVWYMQSIPAEPLQNILQHNPEVMPFSRLFLWTSALVFLGGLLALVRLPLALTRAMVAVLVVIGLAWMGGFEYVREIARKPYVIFGYLYSNSVTLEQAEQIEQDGFLAHAKWIEYDEITPENERDVGRELVAHQCLICHTLGGHNDVIVRTGNLTEFGVTAQLDGQGKINSYMPPFLGSQEEKEAVAAYISRDLHGQEPFEPFPSIDVAEEGTAIPEFSRRDAEYVILPWNDLGMHCISDSDPWFVILPPANTLWAQLIRRGPLPEVVTEGVTLSYQVEPGFEHPERHVEFWSHVKSNFGADLTPPTGLFGFAMAGELHAHPDKGAFIAEGIPVVPYPDDGGYMPFPIFEIEAHDSDSGELLARSRVVGPTATEMGCRRCHGGEWRVAGRAGFSSATSRAILEVHDRMNGTQLAPEAEAGRPRLCQSCHEDPVLGAAGEEGILNLPAALHGFHANYLPDMAELACACCHPAHTEGPTRCLRGRHGEDGAGLTCVECHGALEDHALSLLAKEKERGKPSAARLMRGLEPELVETTDDIVARMPWINEPDCLNCHVDYSLQGIDGFNRWTPGAECLYRNRRGPRGLYCPACHGAPHAVYPATNPYGGTRDNIPPLQVQGDPGTIGTEGNCAVCHGKAMNVEGHHRNMARR